MFNYPNFIEEMISQFAKLPGVGYKSAVRFAMHVFSMGSDDVKEFSDTIIKSRINVKLCKNCFNYTEHELCDVCMDKGRDVKVICVIEGVKDLYAFEKMKRYNGLYHVLHGRIIPSRGIGPESIKIKELLERLSNDTKEVILATNPNVEGEATAMYISKLINNYGVKTSKIAHGIPLGGDIEYVDEMTLMAAFESRLNF